MVGNMNDLDDRLKSLFSRSREGKHFEEIRLSNKTPTGDGKEGTNDTCNKI